MKLEISEWNEWVNHLEQTNSLEWIRLSNAVYGRERAI